MATFLNKDPNQGFDPGPVGAMPWQMVPLAGARGLKLLDGPDLDIFIDHRIGGGGVWGGLIFSETQLVGARHREIWLQGRSPASTLSVRSSKRLM
jgi:hypothetical protein